MKYVETANAGYTAAYEKHGAGVIPGEMLLKEDKYYNSGDGIHPNKEGSTEYGKKLCQYIELFKYI